MIKPALGSSGLRGMRDAYCICLTLIFVMKYKTDKYKYLHLTAAASVE